MYVYSKNYMLLAELDILCLKDTSCLRNKYFSVGKEVLDSAEVTLVSLRHNSMGYLPSQVTSFRFHQINMPFTRNMLMVPKTGLLII